MLPVSLADSGKSRADLWSFAASVAVEWGVDRNNHGCEGNDTIGEVVSAVAHSALLQSVGLLSFHTGRIYEDAI